MATLLGLLAATAVTALTTPKYTSWTQLFVSTPDSLSTSEAFQGGQFSQQRVQSYAQLIDGEELAARVAASLDLDTSPEDLTAQISASAIPDTVLLDVSVTDPSPERAQAIAEAIGVLFPRFATELELTQAGESPVRVTVVDPAGLPREPSSPLWPVNLGIGALVGLLAGAAAAVARVRLDRSVRQPEDAGELAGAPVLGTVLKDEALATRHVVDHRNPSRTIEDFRQLRTNLPYLDVDDPPKVILVSSPLPGEGKTTLVVNLALAIADAGRSVTIVEADLRRPKVTRYLSLVSGVGLTNVLAGTADLDEVLQPYGDGVLRVLASGPAAPNPGELLSSTQMASLIAKLRAQSDYVLVDAPPLLPVADASAVAALTDGVLLSVRYGTTRKEQLREAALTLQRVSARTLGVVISMVPRTADIAGAYGYGSAYDYAVESAPETPSRRHRRGRGRAARSRRTEH